VLLRRRRFSRRMRLACEARMHNLV
jgi:hypothetical protein